MAKKTEIPEWWDQPEVQEWIINFEKPKSYRRNFIKWVEWIDMLPDEQLRLRKEQAKSNDKKTQRFFEEKLKEYGREIMRQGLTAKTGEQYLIAVRSFFTHHYEPMKFKRREVAKVLKETPEVKAKQTVKQLHTNEEIRAIFDVSVPRDKPLILILSQTGLSETDVSELRIEALDIYKRDREGTIEGVKTDYVYGRKKRNKSDIPQHFILGPETLYYLEPILRERKYPTSGYLLITRQGNPYTSKSINERMKTLTKMALGEHREAQLETKNIRDYFMNGLRQGEVSLGVFKAMIGHKRDGASQNYLISEPVILQAFNKSKKYFSIDGDKQAGEELSRVKGEVADLYLSNQALTESITQIQAQLNEFRELLQLEEDSLIKMKELGYKWELKLSRIEEEEN